MKTSNDSETPAENQQVITACAFIHHRFNNTEKVFLPKRAKTKKFLPDVYELPGGHIEFGEDPITGLRREIFEEFKMNINVGDPFYVFTYQNNIKKSHSAEIIYFAVFTDKLEKISINQEDHSEYGWFSENEIKNILSENKNKNDPEIMAIYKGFSLLKGKEINFGL